jgi:UDP-3-O-[3-hydroxymyristoyl] glucosamine N-acyltransferase
MPDPRFYEDLGPISLGALADLAGARLADPSLADRPIARAATLAAAGGDAVSFLSDSKHAAHLAVSAAGACFLREADADMAPDGCAVLITALPQAGYAAAAARLHRARRHASGDPPIHPSAQIEDGADLTYGVVVGRGAKVGRGTHVAPGAVIGPGVAIGRDGYVGPGASIVCALIGDRVSIYAGAVIGEAGFGATLGPRGIVDVPQLGRVILQDGVTIGAGTTVDRGAYEDTVIGENTKIDNLVQIAHNVVIGRNCVLAAHTGISGSVTIGDGCQLGGRVGIADHVKVGAGVRLAANAGLMSNVPPGETWGGFPARPIRRWLREQATLGRMARGGRSGGGQG